MEVCEAEGSEVAQRERDLGRDAPPLAQLGAVHEVQRGAQVQSPSHDHGQA